MGYSAKDFHPDNCIYVGGGLKRALLPDDYQEFVHETFNIPHNRDFQNYSMQELNSGMPKCRECGRYHVPPWIVPMILDKDGDNLLPYDLEAARSKAAPRSSTCRSTAAGAGSSLATGSRSTTVPAVAATRARRSATTSPAMRTLKATTRSAAPGRSMPMCGGWLRLMATPLPVAGRGARAGS